MKRIFAILALSVLVVQAYPTLAGASGSPYANWTSSAYDPYNTNNDPQNTINLDNVANLQVRWIYQVPVNPFNIPAAAPALGIETSPLVVSGVVYFATPYNRVVALNAATGRELWSYQVNMSRFLDDAWWARAYTISSMAYYNGSIYFTSSDTSVYGLNALTGAQEFVIPGTGSSIPGNTGYYFGEKAPLLFRNTLIVPASTTDYGGRGYVAAYNVKTKGLLWRWYSVPPAGGSSNWDNYSALGNIQGYPGDWGTTGFIGGGAAWGLMALDNHTGVLYLSTGHPSGTYDAALRPGPNLYTDSVIALNATNGRMLWYYQINPHDITEHEGGWSITLANITVGGQRHEAVIQAAKSNFIYVLDALSGKPLISPIYIGSPPANNVNDNSGSHANLTASQSLLLRASICPGDDGGVEMSPALDGNNLFVVSQNACALMSKGTVEYKGENINGFIYEGNPAAKQNSTLYSIDLSTGQVRWRFPMPDRYQGSSAVVSGGVVYVVDRQGTLYMVNELTGGLIRGINLNGLGASGVSIGEDSNGQMMIFAPVGGGGLPSSSPGVVVGFYLPGQPSSSLALAYLQELPAAGLGAAVIALSVYILWSRSKRRMAEGRT